MKKAALLKKEKIEKLFLKAQMHDLIQLKNRLFASSNVSVESPFQKLYLLKKLYSTINCMIANNMFEEEINPELARLLQKSSRMYFYFILEMQTEFNKINRHFLLLLLCKHLCMLLAKLKKHPKVPTPFSLNKNLKVIFKFQSQRKNKLSYSQRLSTLVDKFISNQMINVSNTTILSGHDTTINTILTFLQSEPFNINKGYKKLKKFQNYPPKFGASLGFQLEPCPLCPSGYRVRIKYEFQEIIPFFCKRKEGCDLLKFLEYIDNVEDFDFKKKKDDFQIFKNNEF